MAKDNIIGFDFHNQYYFYIIVYISSQRLAIFEGFATRDTEIAGVNISSSTSLAGQVFSADGGYFAHGPQVADELRLMAQTGEHVGS